MPYNAIATIIACNYINTPPAPSGQNYQVQVQWAMNDGNEHELSVVYFSWGTSFTELIAAIKTQIIADALTNDSVTITADAIQFLGYTICST